MDHQSNNANLVALALKYIQSSYHFSCQHINDYIQHTLWPGRIQKVQKSPDVIFDVAHNSHSLCAFITYFHQQKTCYKKAFLIIGFEKGKAIEKELPELYQDFDYIDCTETKTRNSMSAEFLFNLYKPKNKIININQNPSQIIQKRFNNLPTDDVLVILGSHYFGPYIQNIYKK